MKHFLRMLFAVLFIVCSGNLMAQERTVRGKVISQDDGTELPGVNVILKGTTVGTVTDIDGNYFVSIPEEGGTLIFSFVGYMTKEVPVTNQTTVNIDLASDVTELSEVVVVAYGTADKRSYTGSLADVKSDQIEKRPIANATNAIAGKIAGVQTTAASGQPGDAGSIRIRGYGSINAASNPLYIVDGVPYDQSINNLNTQDIESISVLKDAASAALYGARAANGVVIITTKKGKKDAPTFNLSVVQGVSSRAIPEYERLNAKEYYPLMWEAYRNSLALPGSPEEEAANQTASEDIAGLLAYNPFDVAGDQLVNTNGELNPNANVIYDDLDWFEPLERTGYRQDYNLSYGGANETTTYRVSLGYLDEAGYVKNSDFERWTARLNVETKPLEWLSTGLNVSATYTEANNARTTGSSSYVNPFFFARNIGPIYPVYEHDPATGEYILDENGEKIFDLGFGPPARPSGASPGRHVVQETLLNVDAFKRTVVSGRSFVDAEFLKNFTFRANFGVDLYSIYEFSYDNKIVGDGAPAGRASRTNSTETSLTLNQILTYDRNFGQMHHLDIAVGHESYSFVDNYFYGSRQGQIVEGIDELINFTTTNNLYSYTGDYALEGFFSRLNYDYDARFYVSGSIRRDGSSRFSEDVRWGTFYSFGASWRMESEPFIRNVSWINALKLRASYGELGNDNLGGYYVSQGLYELGYNNADEPGFLQASLAAPALKWEGIVSMDIGTDFVILDGRVSGTIEWYRREAQDLLFDVPLPLSNGAPEGTIPRNIGNMNNKGFEFQINADIVKTEAVTWNLDINASTLTNEVTKLPQEEIINGTKKLTVGRSIYDYWLREYIGVNPENGDPLFRAENYDETEDLIVGMDTLTSSYSNGRLHYAGTAIPDVFGGITNTVTFKGFTLSALLTYQIGGEVYDNGYQSLLGGADYGDAIHKDALNRWQQPGDITDVPRVDVTNNSNSGATSDRWLTSATHMNLRQVTLSYTIPAAFLQRVKLKSANVYVSGENLKLWNKRDGMNVIQSFTGVTSNVYIPSRVLSVGINLGL